MGTLGPIGIIVAGFYIALRTSPRGAILTGVVVGLALALFERILPTDPNAWFLTACASRVLGAVIAYVLANRFDSILGFLLTVPLGFVLILAGGPIELVQSCFR